MISIRSCPICNLEQFEDYLKIKDHSISGEYFKLLKCSSCQFILTSPRPDDEQLGKYYQSKEYISHSDTNIGIVNKIYRIIRNYTLKQKIELIKNLNQQPNLIDIGSGAGYFLDACQKAGFNGFGIEPDETTRAGSISKFNIQVFDESYLNQIPESSIDLISMWHVLEHVPALNQRLQEIYKILKPNAYLIIAVPNCSSFDSKHYKEYWAGYDVPRHLWHFTPNTIIKLLSQHSFMHIKTLPMYFDSYYVSMLSEKYKHNFLGLIYGVAIGFLSNAKAFFSKKNRYSSQIYIFSKN
ncbi:MAG TPA: class I SAM-dependent methyltransferase [Saprospiraceae bacterium]|nr:class I SAM-dependent methyltransferase [Saprospiraceae bacterium]